MITLKTLLSLTPEEQLTAVINSEYKLALHPDQLTFGAVTETGDRSTVVISPNPDAIGLREISGVLHQEYEKLSLESVFGTAVSAVIDFPITIYDFMSAVQKTSGIVFTERDFINRVLRGYGERIEASPQSLRWKGGFTLGLPRDTKYHISQIVVENTLKGFLK
jgi:hypothetical protein